MIVNFFLKFRYIFVIAVLFLLINSFVFMIVGAVECVQGYIEIIDAGFKSSDTFRPGIHLLDGLDYFVSSLVFMIFGIGLGQLFLVEEASIDLLPEKLKINSLKDLKILLWETILIALVIFCVTHLLRSNIKSWDLLPFPILILVLAIALFFMKFEGLGNRYPKPEKN